MSLNKKFLGYLGLCFVIILILLSVRHLFVDDYPDFNSFTNVNEKKQHFFNFMRPIVDAENRKILVSREKLLLLEQRFNKDKSLNSKDEKWIKSLAEQYKIEMASIDDDVSWMSLKRRVDIIPISLALAQSANESSWGTSRFAREGNNLFGQWCFSEGCGLVPRQRIEGATHEVAMFDSVQQSVAAYLANLNTLIAYQPLRTIRLTYREEGRELTGSDLAEGLLNYSELGEQYVEDIQTMIRINKSIMLAD